MKIIKALIIFTLFLIMTGCATQPQKILVKSGATQEDFRRDALTCKQFGMQSAVTNGLAGNMFVDIHIQNRVSECMAELGWH